jgi:hypothetical protein
MTTVSVTIDNAPAPTNITSKDLAPGYYIIRYADREHVALVVGTHEQKRAYTLDDPRNLYWISPFILTVVRPVTELSITVK